MKVLHDKDILNPELLDDLAGQAEAQYLVSLDGYVDEVFERYSSGTGNYGQTLPWQKTHDVVRLRPGEVTIWAGINGHGKSMLTSHVMAHVMKSETVLIASLEMPISATGHRMSRQILGTMNPTRHAVERALAWTTGRLWVYDQLDTVQSDRILAMVTYAFKVLKLQHVVIDSLMKCGISPEDYPKQKAFVDRLCWIAKTYQGHIHLVHHIRKGEKETSRPDKFDIKGAGEITDLVDNVCIVFRNKAKEAEAAKQKAKEGMVSDEVTKKPDCELIIAKQRHGEWEGSVGLWFDKSSQQYIEYPSGRLEWFDIGQINKQDSVPPNDQMGGHD